MDGLVDWMIDGLGWWIDGWVGSWMDWRVRVSVKGGLHRQAHSQDSRQTHTHKCTHPHTYLLKELGAKVLLPPHLFNGSCIEFIHLFIQLWCTIYGVISPDHLDLNDRDAVRSDQDAVMECELWVIVSVKVMLYGTENGIYG